MPKYRQKGKLSVFKQGKYYTWYFAIIDYAQRQDRQKGDGGVYERHHVIPKSLGGSNDKRNLVLLTPREHYICHLLLPKMCIDQRHIYKMTYAFFSMAKSELHPNRYSSRLYQIHRKAMIENVSGEKSVHWKKRKSKEQTDKMVATRRQRGQCDPENNGMYGKKHTKESLQLISQNRKAVVNIDTMIEANPFSKKITDGTVVYRSFREASRLLGVHRRVIKRMLDDGTMFYMDKIE
jgi:hypothetical protein